MYWRLFLTFLKIGAFTFGGGWAMISIIEREVVTNRKWLNGEEFLDLLSLAQSLPGILAVNIAVVMLHISAPTISHGQVSSSFSTLS